MKISINNYCNSKCPYCFAKNMAIDGETSITKENFITALEWAIKNKESNFTLLGGEPTLHPSFSELIDIFKQYKKENEIHLTILTNGIKLYKYLDILPAGTSILLNVVPEEELGPAGEIGLQLTLEKLIAKKCFAEKNPLFTVALGCNIHHEKTDYEYFWRINDYCGNHLVRTSVASPQNSKWIYDRDGYFKTMKPIFLKFVDQAIKRNAKVLIDCNEIPPCYFNGLEMAKISRLVESGILSLGICSTTIQYLPDLKCECCFGDADFQTESKNIKDFNSEEEALSFFHNKRMSRLEAHYLEKCDDCEFKKRKWCYSGCLGFKDGKGEKNNESSN